MTWQRAPGTPRRRKADPRSGSHLAQGELAFLAPRPTGAAGAAAESPILRQHRQQRLRNQSACSSRAEDGLDPLHVDCR